MQARKILQKLKQEKNLRVLQEIEHDGINIIKNGKKMLNLASNDYLGVANDNNLRAEFFDTTNDDRMLLGSTSSRSLSGNHRIYMQLEEYISSKFFSKSCLLFNSGYHLNISCIKALSELSNTLFIVDKFVHASVIDGLRLGGKRFMRYGHNDMLELCEMLEKQHKNYEKIIIVSEGLFSMEGDFAPLKSLCTLKKRYDNVFLYIDEAHSVGVFGDNGLGLVSALGYGDYVDFLVFTFGKAIGSCGASILCPKHYKEFFINRARGFIYSTALPPINVAWSFFVFQKLESLQQRRKKLCELSIFLRTKCLECDISLIGKNQILSIIVHTNENALNLSNKLSESNFFAPAIKTPSVPPNTARIRISLTSDMQEFMIEKLVKVLQENAKF